MPLLVAGLLAQATTTTTTVQNVQSKNPILPSFPEIVWGLVSFVVLFLVLWKLAYPAIHKIMQDRTNTIRGNIEEAERVRTEAETILEEYQRQLADARNESNRIIEEARQAAEQVRRELIRRAEDEVAELRRRNTEDLVAAQERIVGQLQSQVRTLAIDLAERVVGANLDRDQNLRLVDQFVAELNARPAADTGGPRAGS
ncbi:MAG TPA: F0F1 ATP synthase subunit B [Acidimicrobiales bacterium]